MIENLAPTLPEEDTAWPDEMEAGPEHTPTDDFDLSRLWRRVRREQAQIDRFKRYLARVTEAVQQAIDARQRRIDEIKQLTIAYLGPGGATKAVLPDLGTVFLTRRKRVEIDAEAALAWAVAEAPHLVLREPRLDRDGFKKHLLETGEVLPGVAAVEEVTSVSFRPR